MLIVLISLVLAIVMLGLFYQKVPYLNSIGSKLLQLAISQSFVLSLGIGYITWAGTKNIPQGYSDFISGTVSFSFASKSADFYGLYAAVLSFIFICYLLFSLYLSAKNVNISTESIVNLSLITLIPFAVMVGQWLKVQNTIRLLMVSVVLVLLGQLMLAFLIILTKKAVIAPSQVFEIGVRSLLSILFCVFSALGFMLVANRLGFLNITKEISVIWGSFSFALLIFLVFRRIDFVKKQNIFFLFSQVGIPFLLTALASPPVTLIDGTRTWIQYQPIFYFLLIGAVSYTFFDIYGHLIRGERNPKYVSLWVLGALLVYFSMEMHSWPSINPDDYHAGESYLPWWLFRGYDYLPFVDYQPARGLVNYLPGFFTQLFFDNTFSGQVMIAGILSALAALAVFIVLRLWLGDFLAFGIAISIPGYIVWNFYLTFLAALYLLGFDKKNSFSDIQKLWIFGLSLPIIWLFQVTEGTSVALGLLPMAVYLLIIVWKKERRSLFKSLGIFALLFLIISIYFPFINNIVLGAIRYVLENGSVNDVAHGIPWQFTQSYTRGLLWQFFQFSWLLLIIPLIYYLIHSLHEIKTYVNNHRFFVLLTLLIITIVLIPRSAGRIDPDSFNRPFTASLILIVVGLPIIIFPTLLSQTKKIQFVLVFGIVLGIFGSQESQLARMMQIPVQKLHQPTQSISDTELYGVGENVLMDKTQMSRQQAIKKVLGVVLNSQETYYDVTDHNSNYGFQDRPSPVTDTAFYNIPTSAQQFRLIAQLEEKKIPLALISAENILHDGGTLPLRAFWIYRYLLENYIPFEDSSGYVWMIRKGEETRLIDTPYHIGTKQEQLLLLENAFEQYELLGLPASWGNSYGTLIKKLDNPIDLMEITTDISQEDMIVDDKGQWTISGKKPSIIIDFPTKANSDFLFLETVQNSCRGTVSVSWKNKFTNDTQISSFSFQNISDKFFIPVSASPSWYMSSSVNEISITFYPETECQIAIKSLMLYSRTFP